MNEVILPCLRCSGWGYEVGLVLIYQKVAEWHPCKECDGTGVYKPVEGNL